jgi:hypothetical protein
MHFARRAGTLLALATLSFAPLQPAHADPQESVYSPIVEQGELEFELKSGWAKLRQDGADAGRIDGQSLSVGYGVTRWWFTEIGANWLKPPGSSRGFDAWEWENRFQLTETGRYFADLGLLLEIERPKDHSEGYELRYGPLIQADFGTQWQGNLNLLFERHVKADAPSRIEFGYQWQLKNRWRRAFEWGLQGFGTAGPWDDWAPSGEQAHIAGPAVFGKLRLGGQQVLNYNVGYLLPLNKGAPRNTIRLQLEFEI